MSAAVFKALTLVTIQPRTIISDSLECGGTFTFGVAVAVAMVISVGEKSYDDTETRSKSLAVREFRRCRKTVDFATMSLDLYSLSCL